MIKSKVSLILIIIFSVLLCVLAGGYVTLKIFTSDKAIQSRITKTLEGFTGGKLNIGHAYFDLFKGLSLDKVRFEGKNPEDLRIEVERILVRYEPSALLRGEILINSIMIISPELFVAKEEDAIWKFLNGVKALLDHSGLKYPTDQLRRGVIVKAANIHVFDKVFRNGVLDIENLDLFGQQLGGSLRDIIIKGIINDGFWKGLELNVDTNLATPELKLIARVRDKTMTEELMLELPVIGEKFWNTYSPVGKFNFGCTLDFNNKNYERKMDYLLELDVVDGEMTYIKWPFLIKNVNGKLEFSKKGTFLKSMKGDIQNEGKQSYGEIDAFFGLGNAKKIVNLNVPNFNITETLLKMIPDVGEKVWKDYRPEGNIDLTIKYESNEDASVIDYSAEAICKGIKARHPNIPYDLSNIVGLIRNDGKNIYLKNMSGYLLSGTKTNRTMFDGVIDLESKEKRFTVSIPNLDLTEDIVKNIPKKGEDIWHTYKPAGQVDFTADYKGFEDSSKDEYIITVDGKGNELEYADLSIKLSDVIGRVIVDKDDVQLKNIQGYIVNDDQLARAVCNGVYKLRNKEKKTLFNIFDLRVTDGLLDKFSKQLKNEWLKIEPVGRVNVALEDEINSVNGKDKHTITIDAMGCEVGLNNLPARIGSGGPVRITDIDGRINIEDGQLTSRNFIGIFNGGNVNGLIKLDRTTPNGAYAGNLNFEKVSLQKLMENFVKDKQKWTGECEGNVEFQGEGKGLKNLTAKGRAKLREGYLSEVPVLLSILKLLNLSIPKKETFHTANIKYSIKDKVIHVEELEVFSDSVELGCIGTAGFDGAIDLTVVAGFNKETFSQIPFIGGLMDFVVGGVRKTLTKVQITGTLSDPKSTMIGLKPFTHPIKSIFDVLSKTKEDKEEGTKQEDEKGNTESDT
ncbi:MAG: AsmA-like C-terminal domain-containing protein [Planctomycetota bacterium]